MITHLEEKLMRENVDLRAQLTTERELFQQLKTSSEALTVELRRQVDAERERADKAEAHAKYWEAAGDERLRRAITAENQLAAAKLDVERLDWLNRAWPNLNMKLLSQWDDIRAAIDAAREKEKP